MVWPVARAEPYSLVPTDNIELSDLSPEKVSVLEVGLLNTQICSALVRIRLFVILIDRNW